MSAPAAPRTVVKAAFTPRALGGGARSRAAMDYYLHRPDPEGQRTEREAFDQRGARLEPEQALARVKEAQGRLDYRLVLSPAPAESAGWSEHEWRDWTRESLRELTERHPKLEWLAVQHDHDAHPHVHAWLSVDRPLHPAELREIRERGDALSERAQERWLGLEGHEQAQHLEPMTAARERGLDWD